MPSGPWMAESGPGHDGGGGLANCHRQHAAVWKNHTDRLAGMGTYTDSRDVGHADSTTVLDWHERFGHGALCPWRLSARLEPIYRCIVTRYALRPPRWPAGTCRLRAVIVADIHACNRPSMSLARIDSLVDLANGLGVDVVLLARRLLGQPSLPHGKTQHADIAKSLSGLRAPLGVHAILGNHDWWADSRHNAYAVDRSGATWPGARRLPCL